MTGARHLPRVMAVSSGGGHWVQLLRVAPAFATCEVVFVTVRESYRSQVRGARFYAINDATRWNKIGLITMALRLASLIIREKPDIIISTGAAPGYIALRLGRLVRARTIWLDSFANVDRLSMSGQRVGPYADLWLTQWPHLAASSGPRYEGSVL